MTTQEQPESRDRTPLSPESGPQGLEAGACQVPLQCRACEVTGSNPLQVLLAGGEAITELEGVHRRPVRTIKGLDQQSCEDSGTGYLRKETSQGGVINWPGLEKGDQELPFALAGNSRTTGLQCDSMVGNAQLAKGQTMVGLWNSLPHEAVEAKNLGR